MSLLCRSAVAMGCCAAALAAASPAGAAWTAPQEIPGSAARYPVFAAYGQGGATTIGMYGPLALLPASPQAPIALATQPAGGASGAPAALPDGLGTPLALSPNGTLLAVGGPRSPLDFFSVERARARLRVAIGPLGGALRRIPTHAIVGTKTLAAAVNDSGDAAVVFSRCVDEDCSTRTVLATFRRRGRGFTPPIVLARRTGYPAAAVALNARGDAIVAWIQRRARGRGNDVRTRMRRASGTLTKLRLAGPTAPAPTIVATLTDGLRGTVAWFSQPVGEGSIGGALRVAQVVMDSRGTIGALHLLDNGNPTGHGEDDAVRGARLRVILGADSAPTYAWTGFANGRYVVRAQRLHRGVGQVETLSPPSVDAQLMDLATDVAGDVLAVWATVPGPSTVPGVAAVIRPAGALTFGAPQLVLAGGDASASAAGAIAPGGRAVVAGGSQPAINGPGAGVRVTHLAG